ncbi:pimeloyl-ACP methyl ester carboxylesterase [Sphingobium sp. OAS761]|uniref:alpha/beta fold hydrolase n=1 Tax=Sphingobium sp. OAS761 TaxID=2817901 RepID=UPI0020A01B22|nr:alpha/beta hydrolase [Sphingobium sp. OAS761]MCP1468382.1 pimeloyl-ACP methyl ester carboxylesterase [Sphingobium sp. OAS761]
MTTRLIDRRALLGGAAAAAGLCRWPGAAFAATPFASRRIAVTVRGEGRDLLLIPGLASGPAIWNDVVTGLPGYRVHLIHVRGFAGLAAQANADGPLLRPLADEIARYVSEARLGRPAVVGHSMGGMLAMMLGLRGVPGRVMVVDMLPAGAAMVGGTASGLGFLADQLSGYLTGTVAGRRYLATMVAQAPGARDSDPDVIALALRDLANMDLGPDLRRLSVPLEVVYAIGRDAEQAKAIGQRFRAAYAGKADAQLVAIGPSGHMVMQDQPARFRAALATFLRQI